jgi:hypothetical protein
MLVGEMQKASELGHLANTLRDALLNGSKREMQVRRKEGRHSHMRCTSRLNAPSYASITALVGSDVAVVHL